MKQYLRLSILFLAVFAVSNSRAQQVNTMYFLENAPMRHVINPAFQPVSNFYMTFPSVGYTSLWAGNNRLILNDLAFNDGNGNTITALHPNADGQLWNKLPNMLNIDADIHLSLFGFGWRIREKGYAHFNITERIITEVGMPKSMFGPLLQQDLNSWDFSSLRASATVYTDFAIGYSHVINEHWTVGGKLKVLLGHTHMSGKFDELQFSSTPEQSALVGSGTIRQAGILRAIAERQDINLSSISNVWNYLSPMGYGGAVDLGMTYKPIKNLQITAAVVDLGFIHWKNGSRAALSIDTTFNGLGDFVFEDYVSGNEFQSDSLLADITTGLEQYGTAIHMDQIREKPFNQMLHTTLSLGIDANFWKNRVGVGVYSRTRFHNNRVSEEITLGAAFRPVNWFHLAASYSFLNGKWSNIGGGISFALYDGFMFTVVADYVPLSYADYTVSDEMVVPLPYKTRGLNLAFGMAIVAGTNPKKKRDKDKDGIMDDIDKCLNTPLNVRVDTDGCPMDSDGDGIADYMDECPNTPAAAYESIDAHGCPLDTDGDSVPDYMDLCANTPKEAHGMVDQYGCPIDSDRDGVADYIDECPNTIVAARNQVDEKGCPLDTDGDGIYDYEDLCPTIAGDASNTGCPEIKQQVRTILNKAMKGIQFETGKSTIKASSYGILNEVAKVFIENANYIIEIQGHTDNVGNYQYNIDLSEKRAQAVRDYLIQHGVPAERMTAHGYGPDRPLTTNDTKEGRAVNRRVEFNITFEETTYLEK